jgi:hypothetical protein
MLRYLAVSTMRQLRNTYRQKGNDARKTTRPQFPEAPH